MTFPVDLFLIDDINITDKNAVLTNDTRSLQFRARKIPGQRFEIKLKTRVLPKNRKAAIAYASSLGGGMSIETISLPYFFEADINTKITSGAYAPGVTQVTLQTISGVNAGYYFKFAGHTKLYVVKSIVGNAILFHPNLVRPVAGSETLTFNGVSITVQSLTKAQIYSSQGRHDLLDIDFNFVEVIS